MTIEKRSTEISNRPEIYQIRVEGKLDEGWSVWLDGMAVELESEIPPVTSLTGEVTDQACLRRFSGLFERRRLACAGWLSRDHCRLPEAGDRE